MYVIIDIETTGGNKHNGKITEIAAFLHDGGQVVDRFVRLVNPQQRIDHYVSRLTGITDAMVADAPVFADIADELDRFTANAVFVAHNVNFDYPFVREEFRRLGRDFTRRRLCTVRMSRRAFPDLPSYSLGKITKELSIGFEGHHRAEADAMATVKLFEKIVEKQTRTGLFDWQFGIKQIANINSPLIDEGVLNSIPDDAGVFYLYDREDRLQFVKGTAHLISDLSERLNRRDTANDRAMIESLYRIDWHTTGSPLAAKLTEAHEVLQKAPHFNRGRIGAHVRYAIYAEPDGEHIELHLKKRRGGDTPLAVFSSFKEGMSFFEKRAEKLGRTPRISEDKRIPPSLLLTVEEAEDFLPGGDYIVEDEGRSAENRTLIVVVRGSVRGIIYRGSDEPLEALDFDDFDVRFEDFPEMRMILGKHLSKNSYDRIVDLSTMKG